MGSRVVKPGARGPLLAGFGLAAIGLFLRVHDLGQGSFWVDEAYSARISQLPPMEIISTTAADVHPPLYYLLLRAWMLVFGQGEAAIRSMSLVLDMFAMAAVADLAWLAFRRRGVVLLALALHALSPFAILYAQEARMYSLMLLVSTLSAAWLIRLLRTGTVAAAAVYVLTTALAVYTHMFGFFMVAGQAAFVTVAALVPRFRVGGSGRFGALSARGALGIAIAVAALIAPWAWVVRQQMKWAATVTEKGAWWIPKPPIKGLVGPFYSFGGNSLVFMALSVLLLGFIALTALVYMRGRWGGRWHRTEAPEESHPGVVLLLLVTVLSPILISFVMSHVTTPIYVSRFMMGGFGAFLILLAAAVTLLPHRFAVLGAGAALLALSVWRIPATNYDQNFKANSPWRELSETLKSRPVDQVLYRPDDEWPIDWYLRRRSSLNLARISARAEDRVEVLAERGTIALICRREKCPASLEGKADEAPLARTGVNEFGDLAFATYERLPAGSVSAPPN